LRVKNTGLRYLVWPAKTDFRRAIRFEALSVAGEED